MCLLRANCLDFQVDVSITFHLLYKKNRHIYIFRVPRTWKLTVAAPGAHAGYVHDKSRRIVQLGPSRQGWGGGTCYHLLPLRLNNIYTKLNPVDDRDELPPPVLDTRPSTIYIITLLLLLWFGDRWPLGCSCCVWLRSCGHCSSSEWYKGPTSPRWMIYTPWCPGGGFD